MLSTMSILDMYIIFMFPVDLYIYFSSSKLPVFCLYPSVMFLGEVYLSL